MIHLGKCPKCEKALSYINIQPVDLQEPFGTAVWHVQATRARTADQF